MPRVKLLIVIPSLTGGGAEKLVSLHLRHLDRDRFAPHLLLRQEAVSYALPADVPTTSARAGPGLRGAARFLAAITARLNELRPDLVVSHLPFTNALTALAVRRARHPCPFVAWVHNSIQEARRAPFLRRCALRLQYRLALRRADRFVCCSAGVRDDFCKALRLPNEKAAVIQNPADTEGMAEAIQWRRTHYRPDPRVLRLVHMGRLTEQKGQAYLLEALARLARDREATLTLLGDGPRRKALEAQAQALGIAHRVHFTGFLRPPYAELAKHDLFAFPSLWEGMPVALAEAMALGLPVVAADCPHGPRDLIEDGVHGFLVPVGDVPALVARVQRLAADRALAERLGQAAQQRMLAAFTPEQKTREFEQLCLKTLEQAGRPT
jgi:glycosyltransferase involved in cell wall biosynthesis